MKMGWVTQVWETGVISPACYVGMLAAKGSLAVVKTHPILFKCSISQHSLEYGAFPFLPHIISIDICGIRIPGNRHTLGIAGVEI